MPTESECISMAAMHDMGDLLAGEVLGEMAGNFFGRRKALEDLISLVFTYAETFRDRSSAVADRAGFLAHLLLEPAGAESFYAAVGVDSPQTLIVEGFTPQVLPQKIPLALSGAGRFRKLFRWAYDRLQQTCDEYLYGPVIPSRGVSANEDEIPLSFHLIMKLAQRANAEVADIRQEVSPAAVLQAARNLGAVGPFQKSAGNVNPEMGGNRFDQRLAFSPIDIHALALTRYPELPDGRKVEDEINRFCSRFYSGHRRAVKKMAAGLKKRIDNRFSGPAPRTGDG